jgi:hypothetical protein
LIISQANRYDLLAIMLSVLILLSLITIHS